MLETHRYFYSQVFLHLGIKFLAAIGSVVRGLTISEVAPLRLILLPHRVVRASTTAMIPVVVAKPSVTEDLSVLLVRKGVLIVMEIYSQFVRKGFGRDSNVVLLASNGNENLSYCSRCQ